MDDRTVLKITNINSHLVSTNADLIRFLHEKLRFRPKDYWHNSAYKRKIWDGWKEFFDRKTGRFMTGLLPEVQLALRKLKIPHKIIDERGSINWQYNSIGDDFLDQWVPPGFDTIKLHDYQPDLANQAFKYNRGLIQAPTAAGKTFILVSILKSLPPKTPTLFITKSKSLVHQNWEEMKLWGVPNLGRWYGNYKEGNYVMCATSHTSTFESIKNLLPKFKVLLVDEVHECMSDVPIKAYKKMTNCCVRIGFSATPFKWNKRKTDDVHKWKVKGNFGPPFKTSTTASGLLTTKDLQDRGILSSSDCTFYTIKEPNLAYEPYQDAVKLGIEQNFHFHDVVSRLAKKLTGRTLITVERIEQGEYLSSLLPNAYWIQGKNSLKEREPVINDLKSGENCVAIVMRHIITAGINIKIHNLINASGGEGADRTIQLMGRGLRLAEDKDVLKYFDFYFMINDYLRKHSQWRMDVLEQEGHKVTHKETIDF